MNRATLEGHLGKDPEVRFLNNGGQMATATLATSNDYKDKKSGEWVKKPATWHNIVAFGEAATSLSEARKGEKLKIEGKIAYREYTDKAGVKKYVTEIQAWKVEKPEKSQASQTAFDDTDDVPF